MSYFTPQSGISDVLSTIGSAVKTGVNFYGQAQANAAVADLANKQAAQQTVIQSAPPSEGMPSWVMPVVLIGGVGVVAMVLLNKKKSSTP